MSRTRSRDARVGLILLAAAAGVVALFVVAAGGPGYLITRQTAIDVHFRDGQGIRVGHPVRIAGLDAGRVTAVEVVEHGGALRARVRIAVADEIASKLKQDAVIVIQAGLTGQSSVNIASVGESGVAWVPGQPIEGLERSLFDPILEQVGLGPVERGHLSHTIGEVRGAVDEVSPRLRKILASLQHAAEDVQKASEVAGPAVADASGRIDGLAGRLEALLGEAETLVADVDTVVSENREGLRESVASIRQLSGDASSLVETHGPQLGAMIEKLDQTRIRLDRVLYQAEVAGANVSGILVQNRPEIDRTIVNIRDATDFLRMTTQKIYANPLQISPLYTPGPDAELALANYDTAQVVLKAASEYHDAVKKLQAVRGQPLNPQQEQLVDAMLQRAAQINAQLGPLMHQLAEGVQAHPDRGRGLINRE